MPDRNPAVLLVGGSLRTLRRAAGTGATVVLLQLPGTDQPGAGEYATEVCVVDYRDLDAAVTVAAELHARHGFTRAISLTEYGLLPAAAINERLGLGGNTVATVRLLRDKVAMRERLRAAGVSPVPFAVLASAAELRDFVALHGAPVIVKPVDGAGSLAVARVDAPSEADPTWARLRRATDRPLMAEGYLDGPEISVEAFSFGPGRHRLLAVTGKQVGANFVEIGHVVPATVPTDLLAPVHDLVAAFLNLVDLREGPSHTEIKLTPAGPRIVESHNRVGGDKISDLVELVTGVDQISLSFAWPLGLADEPPAEWGSAAGAAIRFVTPSPGTVVDVTGLSEVQAADAVVAARVTVRPGDAIGDLSHSSARAGYVITQAATGAEAATLADRYAAMIHVWTTVEEYARA